MTEQFVSSWRPDLADFRPPEDSPEAELRAIAGLILKGRFKDAEARLNQIEKSSPALIQERVWLCKMWRLEIAQRQHRFPSGANAVVGISVNALQGVETKKKEWIELVDKSGSNDLKCATHFVLGIIDELTTGDASLLRYRADIDGGVKGKSFEQEPGFLHFIYVKEGVRKDHILPAPVIELLDADVCGQLATAQRRWAEAETHFQRGLKAARDAKLRRAEATFLMRLGDLITARYGNVETLGMSLEVEFGIRPPSLRPFQANDAAPVNPELIKKARVYYADAASAFSAVNGPSRSPALLLREAYVELISQDLKAAIDAYATASTVASEQGDTLQSAYALTARALLTGERKPFEDAAAELWTADYPGGLFQIAECARGAANRLYFITRNPIAAIACIRMASNVLRARGLDQEAGQLLVTEASFGNALGQLDRMVDLIQDVRRSSAVRQVSPNDQARDAVRRGNFQTDLWLLQTILGQFRLDNDQLWIGKAAALLHELNGYGATDPFEISSIKLMAKDVEECKCVARILRARGGPEFATTLKEEWTKAQAFEDPVFLCRLGTYVGSTLPQVRDDVLRILALLHPVDAYSKARTALVNGPSEETKRAADLACSDLTQLLGYASDLEDFDVLDRWIGELESLVDHDAAWEWWRSTARGVRGTIALGRNDASKARQIFQELLAPVESNGSAITQTAQEKATVRHATLAGLLEAHAAVADAPEESLLAYLQFGFERARLQTFRTNIRGDRRLAFELAMLARTSAVEGGLSPADARRQREIEKLLVGMNSRAQDAPPEMKDLREAIGRLVPGTTVLIYHFGKKRGIGWRLNGGEAITMKTINATSSQLEAKIGAFRSKLERNLSGWEENAIELYKLLLEPFGPFPNKQPLIVTESPALASIPVELLGPNAEAPLLATNSVVYAAQLGVFDTSTEAPSIASGQPRGGVVIGIDGVSLDQAEAEATLVAKALDVKPLCGSEATKAAVSERMRNARWVHLATHGTLDLRNPFRSSLELADGPLEAWQLLRLGTGIDTVVLSACDTTAPGSSAAGLDGQTATFAAFTFAGQAQRVMASLWKADDRTTCQLMNRFYDGIIHRAEQPVDALTAAKLELRAQGEPPSKFANMALMIANPALIFTKTEPSGAKRSPSP